jgi:hypothetical protein
MDGERIKSYRGYEIRLARGDSLREARKAVDIAIDGHEREGRARRWFVPWWWKMGRELRRQHQERSDARDRGL